MFHFDEIPMPTLGHTGLDGLLSEKEKAIQEVAHRFAKDVMRPFGDELVINGQTSAWVSGAPIAQSGLVHMPCDYGDGVYREDGENNLLSLKGATWLSKWYQANN